MAERAAVPGCADPAKVGKFEPARANRGASQIEAQIRSGENWHQRSAIPDNKT